MKTGFRHIGRRGLGKDAPRWAHRRHEARLFFPSPHRDGKLDKELAALAAYATEKVLALKQGPHGPGYLGPTPSAGADYDGLNVPDYDAARQASIGAKISTIRKTVDQSVALFEGLPNWNSPLVMPNVVGPANTAAMIAAMMTEIYSPNILEGETAWNVEFAEIETGAMIARLLDWDPRKAGGIYTFGGTGCYLYALKHALTRVFGTQSRKTGIRSPGKLLVSSQGHYVKDNTADWTGLGTDNIIEIETEPGTNAMSMARLRAALEDCRRAGVPVVSVVCTMGTTDSFAVDPVAQVRALLDEYPNPDGYGAPFLYCDAVIGWSWLMFKDYDFDANPLEFSAEVLPHLRANRDAMIEMSHADAIGCDFHKTGWAPYNCSAFVMKDEQEFKDLMSRPGSNYLQERTTYNPGLYTLETSRSAAYCMAGWATLKLFGQEGFQLILAGVLEAQAYFRKQIGAIGSMTVVNEQDNGFVSLFRVYPPDVDARAMYQREFNEDSDEARALLEKYNRFQADIADKLWLWFRTDEYPGERSGRRAPRKYAPYLSYTTGFSTTAYNRAGNAGIPDIFALKAFPMNPNIDRDAIDHVIEAVLKARDAVLEQKSG